MPHKANYTKNRDNMKKIAQIVPIVILALLSSIIIFYKFNEVPKKLFHDESDFLKLALSLDGKAYTPYSELATGHSTLYFYTVLGSLKLFGINNFGLRFPSAIFGVLNVILFYLIMKYVFKQQNKFLPFILTILFTTMHWYFNFARFSFEATFLLFLELMSVLFFLRYFKSNKAWDICLSAFFAGLAYNSYTPGRIFFILIFGYFLIKSLKEFKEIKRIILPTIIFIVVISPLTFYLMTHKDDRFDKQFFLKNTEMAINEKAVFLGQNITSTTLMFINRGDMNARHNYPGKPAINPILGVLALFGLILGIIKHRSGFNLFFLGYFIISIIPPILTYPWENPNMLRSFAVIPSLVYFMGNGLNYFLSLKFNKKLILGVIVLVLLASCIYELRTYFIFQAPIFDTSS